MTAASEDEACNGRGRPRLDRADLCDRSGLVVRVPDQERRTCERAFTGGALIVTVATSPSMVSSATGLMAVIAFLRYWRDDASETSMAFHDAERMFDASRASWVNSRSRRGTRWRWG